MTFSHKGEQALDAWMEEHARVCWVRDRRPWKTEEELIKSVSLPLNLQGNGNHSFHSTLSALRRHAIAQANARPILADKGSRKPTVKQSPTGAEPLVIIACGDRKREGACKAGELYTGPYFRQSLKAAMAATHASRVLILSGKHGFVPLDKILEPYQQRIDQPGAVSLSTLRRQAGARRLLGETKVIVLAGRKYCEVAKEIWPHAETPLANKEQFLKALQQFQKRLANQRAKLTSTGRRG